MKTKAKKTVKETAKRILIILVCVVAFGAICSEGYRYLVNKECGSDESYTYEEFKVPEELKFKSSHLQINCKLDIPKDFDCRKLKKTKAQTIIFSDYSKELYTTFSDILNDADYKEEEIYDDEGIQGTQKLWNRIDSQTHCADCLNLFVSSMYFMSSDYSKCGPGLESLRANEKKEAYKGYPSKFQYNADLFLRELSFASVKDVKETIFEQFEKWGIDSDFDYEWFGVSKDLVIKQYCSVYSDGTIEYRVAESEMDDFKEYYQIYGRQTLQGLPVIYYSNEGMPIYREQSPVKICYSEDGIKYMEINKMFLFNEGVEQIKKLASENKILDTIKQRYDEIITNNTFEIEKGGLSYYALGNGNKLEFEMIPVWCFVVKETNINTREVYESTFLINAITGKEMAYEP